MIDRSSKVVIVGAGLAGAATAYGLVQRGVNKITIVEQEDVPGYYASGRNAAMVCQLEANPQMRQLVTKGLSFFNDRPNLFTESVGFRQCGSLLLASGAQRDCLYQWVNEERQKNGIAAQCLAPDQAQQLSSLINCESFEGAAFTSTDGVADVSAMLHGFLGAARSAGASIRYRCKLLQVDCNHLGVVGVRTTGGDIPCDAVVNGAGAWAGQVGAMAGATPVPLVLLKRHIVQAGPLAKERLKAMPIIWELSRGVYARPEQDDVLLSPCDERPCEPCEPTTDQDALELLAIKLEKSLPGLGEMGLKRIWACIRTFSQDHLPIIGADPSVPGFYWVAALGGSGVGLAPMLSQVAADLLTTGKSPHLEGAKHLVGAARFSGASGAQ